MDKRLSDAINKARVAVSAGAFNDAIKWYGHVLELDVQCIEALHFIGIAYFERGSFASSENLLRQAVALRPDDPKLLTSLGLACQATGNSTDAMTFLVQASLQVAEFPDSALHLGILYEKAGDKFAAFRSYRCAIAAAQKKGHWLSAESTPPFLHDRLGHAMRFIAGFADNHFNSILSSLSTRFGASELQRVKKAIVAHSGKVEVTYPDTRQRPKFFYFPGLPAQPYLGRNLFPWAEQLEQKTEVVRTELQQVLHEDASLEPFLSLTDTADVRDYVRGSKGLAGWEAFFFYRHGERNTDNSIRCPATIAAVDQLPLVRIKHNAPEILFSVLAAGAEITPHRGVTNTRIVAHLPLIVPPDCALNVGGELHIWQEGKLVMFDDTYEHEAWNRSNETRTVLIFDLWNPYLTEIECRSIAELIPEMGLLAAATT